VYAAVDEGEAKWFESQSEKGGSMEKDVSENKGPTRKGGEPHPRMLIQVKE